MEKFRNSIISLRNSGQKSVTIRTILEEEGIKASRLAIGQFLSHFKKTGSINDAPKIGRKPLIGQAELSLIDDKMRENDELTSRELKLAAMYRNKQFVA